MSNIRYCKQVLLENGYTEEDLEEMTSDEIISEAEDIEDTSDMHPNESWDEFMEHENFD